MFKNLSERTSLAHPIKKRGKRVSSSFKSTQTFSASVLLLAILLSNSVSGPILAQTTDEENAMRIAKKLLEEDDQQRKALLDSKAELISQELQSALLALGTALHDKGEPTKALSAYALALQIATRRNDKIGLSRIHLSVASIHSEKGDFASGIEHATRSLELATEFSDQRAIAASRNQLGVNYGRKGESKEALLNLEAAYKVFDELGDKSGIARSASNLGKLHIGLGNYEQARKYVERSVALYRSLSDDTGLSRALSNLSAVEHDEGNYEKALSLALEGLALFEATGHRNGLASHLIDVARAYGSLLDYSKAILYYDRARVIAEELGQKPNHASALSNLAVHYQDLGKYEQAIATLEATIRITSETGDKRTMMRAFNTLGIVYSMQGKGKEGHDNFARSLELARELGSKLEITAALNNLGLHYAGIGDFAKASAVYEESLEIKKQLGNRMEVDRAILNIAELRYRQRDLKAALELANQVAESQSREGAKGFLSPVMVLLGKIYRASGDVNKAIDSFAKSIELIEEQRLRFVIGGADDLQRFMSTRTEPYQQMVVTLAEAGKFDEALEYSDRVKARALLDTFHKGKQDIAASMTEPEKRREAELIRDLTSVNAELYRSRRPRADAARIAALEAELKNKQLNYQAFQTTLYAAHPDLKVKRGDSPLFQISEAIELINSEKEALIEFSVFSDHTLAFVLTADVTAVGKSKTEHKVYRLPVGRAQLSKLIQEFTQLIEQRRSGFQAKAAELYRILLKPTERQLKDRSSIVFVPASVLWGLPFQALQRPSGRYLLEDFAISYAPSFSVLREVGKKRLEKKGSDGDSLLAIGNPDFGSSQSTARKIALMGRELEQLPEAETQVRTLRQLYGASKSTVFFGRAARETEIKKAAPKFRVLHFATHGLLNDADPLHSQIVLSQPQPGDADDGLLEAWELMRMNLQADLMILSACETARGRLTAGEGTVGLAWAGFVAGVPTTVVSQWKVESGSTAELMVEFHRQLLKTKPRVPTKAEAMRQAALKLLGSNRYNHPFYWAPFIVIGDAN